MGYFFCCAFGSKSKFFFGIFQWNHRIKNLETFPAFNALNNAFRHGNQSFAFRMNGYRLIYTLFSAEGQPRGARGYPLEFFLTKCIPGFDDRSLYTSS